MLDKLWDYGPSALYSRIAMDAYRTFALVSRCYHYNSSSSLSVHGEYDERAGRPKSGETPSRITYRHLQCLSQDAAADCRVGHGNGLNGNGL
ncbi:hypothetical protein [Nodosilinea sp. P-1105]|uniref:hypothetical protein n=1 Tax=Nodosilinea sp. P-1105 TaxID=2546229 RepID=UPI001469FF3D|nr:hypothetical protein [Nodosilinea sp. P-1105]